MKSKQVNIKNPIGLHLKPANLLATKAGKYVSQIYIIKGNKKANAKSVLGILGMGVYRGDCVMLECTGEDEEHAVEEISRYIEEEITD